MKVSSSALVSREGERQQWHQEKRKTGEQGARQVSEEHG